MPTFTLYNTDGKAVGTVEQPVLFQEPVNKPLIHRYFLWVRTMLRPTLAHTKTRGEISGGGKKPWKQKGTGRARIGSTRAPHWRHGGVVFGPRNTQNWETRMPRSERRKAMFSALASKAESIIVLDEWNLDAPKTKAVTAMLANFPQATDKKVLHLHGTYEHNLFAATRNLPKVASKTIQSANIIDLLNSDVLVLTKESLEQLEKHFTSAL
jgi:large subunit ribosomal protein L4